MSCCRDVVINQAIEARSGLAPAFSRQRSNRPKGIVEPFCYVGKLAKAAGRRTRTKVPGQEEPRRGIGSGSATWARTFARFQRAKKPLLWSRLSDSIWAVPNYGWNCEVVHALWFKNFDTGYRMLARERSSGGSSGATKCRTCRSLGPQIAVPTPAGPTDCEPGHG